VSTSTKGSKVGTVAGCAIFLAASGGVALAQEQGGDNEEVGEIVVTGLRKSIQD